MRPWGIFAVLLVQGFAVGCYQPPTSRQACAIACTTTCPGDLTCEGGYCVKPGQVCRPAFTQVTAGTGFACGIDDDGAAWCWGSNVHHQISPDDRVQFSLATRIGTQRWEQLDAGGEHVCGIAAGGLACWGANDRGQVSGTVAGDVSAPLPISVAGVSAWTAVSAGFEFTCAIGDGRLFCWGANPSGQLGAGDQLDHPTPTEVMTPLADWIAVSAGREHACAISASAGVHCWGDNQWGEVGPSSPQGAKQTTPIDVPLDGVAGTPLLATAIAVIADASCAITAAGELSCWGRNEAGELGDPAVVPASQLSTTPVRGSDLSGWTAVTGAEQLFCGLASGAVYCWGEAASGGLGGGVWAERRVFNQVIAGGVTALSAGWGYDPDPVTGDDQRNLDLVCALVGTDIQCWGDNRFGQLGRGTPTMALAPTEVTGDLRFTDLRVGDHHACGIAAGGAVYCWGSTMHGQTAGLVNGSSSPRVPCVPELDCDVGAPKEILFAGPSSGLATGALHSCSLHNQVMTCWGDNNSFQLGTQTIGPPRRDVAGPAGRAWQRVIQTGGRGQCATPAPDETWCWAQPLAPAGPINTRTREPGLDGVRAFAPGLDSTCYLDRDGLLVCLGENGTGQFGNGALGATTCNPPNGLCDAGETAQNCPADCCPGGVCDARGLTVLGRSYQTIAASVGNRSACGVRLDGQVECWGVNNRFQTGSDVTDNTYTPHLIAAMSACTAVTVGFEHACAVCGGELRCWGDHRFGQLGTGALALDASSSPLPIAVDLDGDPWAELAAGERFTCARSSSGRVFCWGTSARGALGNGGRSANLPVTVVASPVE